MIRLDGSWPRAVGPLLAIGLLAAPASGQEWTRFRGPNGTGISEATTVPAEWSENDYNWNVKLPGVGHSAPVLWGDKIFLTSALEATGTRVVLCLNAADGDTLWEQRFDSHAGPKHSLNSFASPTPAVDEERVYVVWSTPEEYTLLALDHEGDVVWRRPLGPYWGEHSCGASPIVYENLLILGADQGLSKENPPEAASFLVAVDRHDGTIRWKVDRRTEFVAYSTPCVYVPEGGQPQLIFNSGAHGISSIDPASGDTLWELDVFDKRSCSSPIIAGGLIFGSTGSGGGGNYVAAVRPPSGPDEMPRLEYPVIKESAPYVPSLLAYDGLLFLWSDAGVVSCLRVADGKKVWLHRVGGTYYGSPVCVNGKLYCMNEDGEVVVLAAAEKYKLFGRSPMGEGSHSTPAVADGRMYLRTYSHLMSIGGAKK
ncbi:MAG TPA: PQQ-binding-like beta-propeller repeat protein [Pirellulales bacterium]|nr:PQQ-binding-like beta-propeller repeat protein [Pirellulales bacterium]